MARQESRSPKSLSERLRSHRASAQEAAVNNGERDALPAGTVELKPDTISTIARVMAEGRSGGPLQSRAAAIVHQILEKVEEHPGCDVHELAGWLGEKSIFVLSYVDDLTREGVLLRLENGRLFRSRDFLPVVEEESGPLPEEARLQELNALQRLEQTKIYLRVFRFLTSELELEPECDRKMTAQVEGGKFFEMRGAQGRVNISLYGMFPKEMVERFKREADFDRKRINYSRLTGIIDIRGCREEDLASILPWVGEFYRAVAGNGGRRNRA